MSNTKIDSFTRAYIDCILWAETDESNDSGGQPLDRNFDASDFSPEAMERIIRDCQRFQTEMVDALGACLDQDDARAGHDFWLTRRGHGAGFWDGDWPEPYAAQLTAAAKKFGDPFLYVGDDGQLHFSSEVE